MFSFRKRPKQDDVEEPTLRASPSLPRLPSQSLDANWPEDLVDVAQVNAAVQTSVNDNASFVGGERGRQVSFHKPFRGQNVGNGDGETGGISKIYARESFDVPRPVETPNRPARRPSTSQRRTNQPPTFNVMVVGGQGTGKTSLLRLLLETAEISPTASREQHDAMKKFLNAGTKRTRAIQTACVEICESRFERLLFTVIDSPGLDFSDGREVRLERQVAGIINYLDSQYADTMSEESKVIRQSKGDQHIHLLIYMVDPSAMMTAAEREENFAIPKKATTAQNEQEDVDDEVAERLTMSPAEIRVIRRLSARANVLPVIARADSLTDDKLAAVKEAVRQDLMTAGLDFGVFGPSKAEKDAAKKRAQNGHANGNGAVTRNVEVIAEASDEDDKSDDEDAAAEEEERKARPVIKLRAFRHAASRTDRSRSRRDLKSAADKEGTVPTDIDTDSVANVRFSASIIAKTDLSTLLPFALIAPESKPKPKPIRPTSPKPASIDTARTDSRLSNYSSAVESAHEEDVTIQNQPATPAVVNARNFAYLQGPPEPLKGVFVRKYRWGTVDVLNTEHCDYAALRTAVLSTHIKALKVRTREVLYEKFRTEKLLAYRSTRRIDPVETDKVLKDANA